MKEWVFLSFDPMLVCVNTIQLYLSAIFFAFSDSFFFSEGNTYGIGKPRYLASYSRTDCLFSRRKSSYDVFGLEKIVKILTLL